MSTSMKPALAAERTVAILNYLTVNPRQSFSLLDLSKALGINGASLSSVLLALTRAGFVERDARKAFRLGPALVAAGHAASVPHPIVDLAREEMRRLGALGTERVGSAVVGEEIIMLAIDGRPSPRSAEVRLGQRVPLLPPWGLVFLSWSPPSAIDEWLGRLGSGEPHPDRAVVERSMAASRARGFAIGLDNPAVSEVQRLVREMALTPGEPATRERVRELVPQQGDHYWVDDIDPAALYPVSNIAAPVFGPDGGVIFAITVQGIGTVVGEELVRIGSELAASTRALTRRVGGRAPVPPGDASLLDF